MPRLLGKRFFYGWVIVGGGWILYALHQAALTWGYTIFVKPMGDEFGWSRTAITLAWVLALGWGIFLAPWVGRAFDRFGPKPIIFFGGISAGLGWVLIPFISNYWLFLAVFTLLVGAGINGSMGVAGSSAIAQWFRKRRSLAMGIYYSGSGGGGLILIPLLSIVVTNNGWRSGAVMLGILVFVLAMIVVPLMRHRPEQYGLEVDGSTESNPQKGKRSGSLLPLLKRLPFPKHDSPKEVEFTLSEALHTSGYWMFTIAIFLRYIGMGMTQVHQIPHMIEQGFSPELGVAVLSILLVANIPSRIAIGWMGDVYDKKWLLNMLAIFGGVALLALAVATPSSSGLVWVYAVFWGIALAMLPLQSAWLADAYGRKHYGSIGSLSSSLSLIGRMVGALGAAMAFDLLGGYQLVLVIGAGGFFLGAVLLALLPPSSLLPHLGRGSNVM